MSADCVQAGLFLVLSEVAVFTELPKSPDQSASENAASSCCGGSRLGAELGRLRQGDIIAAEAASSTCDETWLRLLFDSPVRRLVFLDGGDMEEAGGDLGSTDSGSDSSSSYEAETLTVVKVDGTSGLAGGYVLQRHVLIGSLLTWAGPLPGQTARPETASVGGEDLPEEASLWPQHVLERFRATGVRPQWRDTPGEESLGLHNEMTGHEVEEGLRSTAQFLSMAEAVLIVVGPGMAADSGLPTHLPGGHGTWSGCTFEQMCTKQQFTESPQSAWEFWLHYCRMCRQAAPHAGYNVLDLCAEVALHAFVVTTCWDGLCASSVPDECLWECRGNAQELRCSASCTQTWTLPEELLEASKRRSLPICPRCGGPALPATRLFDEAEFRTPASDAQEARFWSWHKRCSAASQLVVLEIGCNPGSEGRRRAEGFARDFDASRVRFVRLNRQFPALPRRLLGRGVAVPLCSCDALVRLKALISGLEMGAFLFQDSHGMGAEVVARRDVPLEFAFRRATAGSTHGQSMVIGFKGASVLHEHRAVELVPEQKVKQDLFFLDRDDAPPVVRVMVTNFLFHDRNHLLQERLRRVWSLIKDLVEAFKADDYQKKFEAAPDRKTALQVIREVHYRVLPRHAYVLPEDGEDLEASKKVQQMQGFLQSGKVDPKVGEALDYTVFLSGYSRLLSKPLMLSSKEKAAPASSRALVLMSEDSQQAVRDTWTHSHRPPKSLWVASTWNNFAPQEMKWDGSKFYHSFQVGGNGWESFQLLLDGRWEQCVYPSIPDGCPFVDHRLLGPDNRGHGKNWTVGRHPEDTAKTGDRLRISVTVNSQGLPKQVSWRKEVRRATPQR